MIRSTGLNLQKKLKGQCDMGMADLYSQELTEKSKKMMFLLGILGAILIVVVFIIVVYARLIDARGFENAYKRTLEKPTVVAVLQNKSREESIRMIDSVQNRDDIIKLLTCFTLLAILSLVALVYNYSRRSVQIKAILDEKTAIETSRFETTASSDYFDELVKINIDNLGTYYVMVKHHTDNSFKIASIVGIAGFLLIALGVILAYLKPPTFSVALLSGISGVLVEAISGLQFSMYNKTIRQLKAYHDSLIHVQNMLLSYKLVGISASSEAKDGMINTIVGSLVCNANLIIPAPIIPADDQNKQGD
jgi:hypothetical protein